MSNIGKVIEFVVNGIPMTRQLVVNAEDLSTQYSANCSVGMALDKANEGDEIVIETMCEDVKVQVLKIDDLPDVR